MTITLLIWARLLLVTDWPRVAVCDHIPDLGNMVEPWHSGGCA